MTADAVTGAVVGVGTDLVEVDRFRRALERHPRMAERLFSVAEQEYAFRHRVPAPRLAVRFAAKEAVMKALGVGLWKFAFHDVEVVRRPGGAPGLTLTGRAAELAAERGAATWHLSLTHTDSMAMAVAVALA